MSDKSNRVRMAQIVAYALHPDMKRFPAANHIAVKKQLKRNFSNLKDVYPVALESLKEQGRILENV